MDKPRIRWIDAHPFVNEGREMVAISDAEGIMENSLVVSKDVLFIISLMDGSRSLRDIQADYMRMHGQLLYMEHLEEIVTAMDQNYLLFNENYRSRCSTLKMEYDKSSVRRPALAGRSYPANRMDLLMALDEMFRTASKKEIGGEVTAIIAPHIDYTRGLQVYQQIYPYARQATKPLVVVFGTCHHITDKIWNISLKDFETPLDIVPVSQKLRSLVKGNDTLRDYVNEWPHRNEHSIELQIPLIQFNMSNDFEILPILTGSMHEYVDGMKDIEDKMLTRLVGGLRDVLSVYGKPYLVIAGADLAHIGAQFGDPYPLGAFTLGQSKIKDEEILACIQEVDALSFFNVIKREKDARRICGLTPIYFLLRLMEGCSAEIVSYDQWTDGKSSVSFAGAVFYK
jgi:AmmeMemoRadiSam system protein B